MFSGRLKKLQASLRHPVLIKKKENLLYLTGCSFIHGYLLVKPRKHADSNADRRGSKSVSPSFLKRELGGVVFLGDGLERIYGVKSDFLKNVGKYIGKKETLEIFGDFTYAEVKYIRSKNKELGIKISVKRDPVDYQRVIKEPGEIALVRKSMQIVERVFKLVRREIKKPGMTEIALAKFIQSAGLKMGAEDVSFPAIVASGVNAAVPHHVPSNKRLRPGESIIIDFGFSAGGGSASGGKYQNYCSDFTRTVFLKRVPKKLEMAYNQVEKAYNESIRMAGVGAGLKPAPTGKDVYDKAVAILAEKHLDKYFIHSLGHGTGLEIHELPNLSPNSKDVLKDGMVFSIEPGVYIKNLGGIRIEDLVYLQQGKVKKFIDVSTKLSDNIF
jgi:Xaa-Pro aminopeptidase